MLSIVMLSVHVMLCVHVCRVCTYAECVRMLSVNSLLNFSMLSAIMLSVKRMLSVMAPNLRLCLQFNLKLATSN
jgi:hypothetical protein